MKDLLTKSVDGMTFTGAETLEHDMGALRAFDGVTDTMGHHLATRSVFDNSEVRLEAKISMPQSLFGWRVGYPGRLESCDSEFLKDVETIGEGRTTGELKYLCAVIIKALLGRIRTEPF